MDWMDILAKKNETKDESSGLLLRGALEIEVTNTTFERFTRTNLSSN